MLYVSIGYTDFGNDILHEQIPLPDVTPKWQELRQYIVKRFGVHPNIRYDSAKPTPKNSSLKLQDVNYLEAVDWFRGHWDFSSGKLLDTIHPDWIRHIKTGCTGYHLTDHNKERQHRLYYNRLRQMLFTDNMTAKELHYFALSATNKITDNIVINTVQRINQVHNLCTVPADYLDRSLFIPLYMLRTDIRLAGIPDERQAFDFFLQNRIKKHSRIDPEHIVWVDDESGISAMGVDYNLFLDKYKQAVA